MADLGEIQVRWSQDDETFIASSPVLPDAIGRGETPLSALVSYLEASDTWIEFAKQIGETVPDDPVVQPFPLDARKAAILKELKHAGIDPALLDRSLALQLDRKLKVVFAVSLLGLSFLFSGMSYAVVVLDAALSWGISDTAITILIAEIPIQFIGLLYLITKHLFANNNPHPEE